MFYSSSGSFSFIWFKFWTEVSSKSISLAPYSSFDTNNQAFINGIRFYCILVDKMFIFLLKIN